MMVQINARRIFLSLWGMVELATMSTESHLLAMRSVPIQGPYWWIHCIPIFPEGPCCVTSDIHKFDWLCLRTMATYWYFIQSSSWSPSLRHHRRLPSLRHHRWPPSLQHQEWLSSFQHQEWLSSLCHQGCPSIQHTSNCHRATSQRSAGAGRGESRLHPVPQR